MAKSVIDLVDKLPPERVVELVEFAEFWSLRRGDKSKNRDEILVAYGAFREKSPVD